MPDDRILLVVRSKQEATHTMTFDPDTAAFYLRYAQQEEEMPAVLVDLETAKTVAGAALAFFMDHPEVRTVAEINEGATKLLDDARDFIEQVLGAE